MRNLTFLMTQLLLGSLVYGAELPVMTFAPEKVCAGVRYLDADRVERVGTRDCTPSPVIADCAADGAHGCRATTDWPAVMTLGLGDKLAIGEVVAGVTGTQLVRPVDCASNAATGCTASNAFPALKTTDLAAADLIDGETLGEVVGTFNLGFGLCQADGEDSCLVDGTTYTPVDTSTLVPQNIRNGVIIGGVIGVYPSVAHPLSGASGVADLNGLNAATTAGAYEWWDATGTRHTGSVLAAPVVAPSSTDQDFNAGIYAAFSVPGDADLVPANVRQGVTLFGVAGNLVEQPAACATDAQVGCLVQGGFVAVEVAALDAADIRAATVIAGVTGNAVEETHVACSADAQVGCVSTATHPAANTSAFVASDFSNAYVLAGVTGLVANCTSDDEEGCRSTGTYPSITQSEVVADKVRSGVTLAGVLGQYPSATYPLATATVAADLPSLAATVAAGSYEWWDALGTRYTGDILDAGAIVPGASAQVFNAGIYRQFVVPGDSELVPANVRSGFNIFSVNGSYAGAPACVADGGADCIVNGIYYAANTASFDGFDIRVGKTVGGVAGKLKFCKNTENNAVYNRTAAPAVAGLDIYDTIDDYNNNNAGLPSGQPFGANFACVASEVFTDVTGGDGCNSLMDDCTYRDNIAKLQWSEQQPAANWNNAIAGCDGLSFAGYDDWRLPTSKEIAQLYVDGVRGVQSANFITTNQWFWTATSRGAAATTTGVMMNLAFGRSGSTAKTTALAYVCVRP